jgi:hypothetical protein
MSAAQVNAELRKAAEQTNQAQQAQPVIQGLAGHIRSFFTIAQQARQSTVEQDMIEAKYARRGQYTPTQRAELEAQGQALIYMMLFSVKARQAVSLLRDVLMGLGSDKPWTVKPSPEPDLPPEEVDQIIRGVAQEVYQAQALGLMPTIDDIKQRLRDARQEVESRIMQEAVARAERVETRMEDQLVEGGFLEALDQIICDLPEYKSVFLAGPIVRRKPREKWVNGQVQVVNDLVLEWERVDPLMIYPAPWASDLQTAPFIRRHRMTRQALNELIGVPGYSDAAIQQVLSEYDTGRTSMWLTIDTQKADAEGKNAMLATTGTDLIDALQYFGTASGKMLREWGLPAEQVPDETKEYEIEAWLVGTTVIKAVLNPDPAGRRPIYSTSYERIPGSVWGNSMYDLMRDCQQVCNAAARALVSNMGISSGPQVVAFTDRLPSGTDLTQMFPWKIWPALSDPMGSTARPIDFFQPTSNAAELMAVYDKFSVLADEYTGIPRYMAGQEAGSIGRTASGLSIMVGNASKIIKSVVGGIDQYVLSPCLQWLYKHNLKNNPDSDMKGDLNIVVRGSLALAAREAAAIRRNEFLQATANPIDMQIIGMEGRAELLREVAKGLDMNTDKVVPPVSVLRQRAAMAQMQAMAAQQLAGKPLQNKPGSRPPQKKPGGGQVLADGEPVTDLFEPTS